MIVVCRKVAVVNMDPGNDELPYPHGSWLFQFPFMILIACDMSFERFLNVETVMNVPLTLRI